MKKLLPILLLLFLAFFTTCEDPTDGDNSTLTCTLNDENWEATETTCDLYLAESCKTRYMKLIATSSGGNQIILTVYNYQDSICDEEIGLYDYNVDNSKNICDNSDTSKLCREVLMDYKSGSGEDFFGKEDIDDVVTITECDAMKKTVSGTFSAHFYNSLNGELTYQAVNGSFKDVNYFIHYYH